MHEPPSYQSSSTALYISSAINYNVPLLRIDFCLRSKVVRIYVGSVPIFARDRMQIITPYTLGTELEQFHSNMKFESWM